MKEYIKVPVEGIYKYKPKGTKAYTWTEALCWALEYYSHHNELENYTDMMYRFRYSSAMTSRFRASLKKLIPELAE